MKIVMIRVNALEDMEAIMTRFLNGLNINNANMVELQYYLEIKYMVHMTIKMEKQLKRKVNAIPYNYLEFSQSWKSNFRKEGIA
jgi:hypothetical protein